MDFFEQQHLAKRKTRLLVFYFVLAVVLICAVLNFAAFQIGNISGHFLLTWKQWFVSPWFFYITGGTLLIIVLGSILRGIQISGGGHSVAKMVNARAVSMDSKDKLERRLINVVEEMSIASGMPVPSLFIMDNEAGMNAFVAGQAPSDTVMVVTQGLLENLNRQELQGVVAHEFSHIFNADMSMNVRLIAILGGILALGQLGYFLLRSLRYKSYRRRSSSSSSNQMGLVVVGVAITLLAVGYIGLFFGRLIKAAISRQREYLADASAVQYSRDSMGIANALYRIKNNGRGSLLDSSHAEDMSHMCFGNALNFSAFSNMLATHPPIDDRIKKLVPGYRSINQERGSSLNIDGDAAAVGIVAGASGFAGSSSGSSANSAEQLINQVGQLNPEHMAQASMIRKNIPQSLRDAAHGSKTADLLILAIIAAETDDTFENMISAINKRLNEDQLAKIKDYLIETKELSNPLILPLIEMAMPALKQATEDDKKNLLACSSLLIRADMTIKPFEFLLYALLRKHLSQADAKFSQTVFRKYKPLLNDIQFLISVLSEAGGELDRTAVTMAMQSFDPDWQVPDELPGYDASQLNKSLQRLNRLTPLLKKPLMQTLAEIVMQDGEIKTAEIELLRATGIYLESPIPPLLQ
ncbi:MAG: M48 family metallopeptidase [Gammaproteobacteria bacterium]|nr:M48 family metallopeptidase [Gammaproteobacteria bacterium]